MKPLPRIYRTDVLEQGMEVPGKGYCSRVVGFQMFGVNYAGKRRQMTIRGEMDIDKEWAQKAFLQSMREPSKRKQPVAKQLVEHRLLERNPA